jgi:hypothetical protein
MTSPEVSRLLIPARELADILKTHGFEVSGLSIWEDCVFIDLSDGRSVHICEDGTCRVSKFDDRTEILTSEPERRNIVVRQVIEDLRHVALRQVAQ